MLATDLLFCLHRVQQLPQAPCLATFPPMMGCPEAPSLQVSFRYVLAWGPVLGRWEERRTGESSSVCHGLNTVALCWLRPCTSSHPLLEKLQKGRKRWECAYLQAGYGSALCPLRCGGRLVVQASVELFFLTKGVFLVFPLLMSKPSFVSVLLPLSSSCLSFLSKLQTLGVTRKTRTPLPPAGLSILLLVNH